jgi:hypothetical protein
MRVNGTKVTMACLGDGSAKFEIRDSQNFRRVIFCDTGPVGVVGQMRWEAAERPIREYFRSAFNLSDGFRRATIMQALARGPWPLDELGVFELKRMEPDRGLRTQLALESEEMDFVFNLVRECFISIHHCALSLGMAPRATMVLANAVPAVAQVLAEMFQEESNDHD